MVVQLAIYMALDGNANAYISEWASGRRRGAGADFCQWIYRRDTAESELRVGGGLVLQPRTGVAVDSGGNVYVADGDTKTVLKMSFDTALGITRRRQLRGQWITRTSGRASSF